MRTRTDLLTLNQTLRTSLYRNKELLVNRASKLSASKTPTGERGKCLHASSLSCPFLSKNETIVAFQDGDTYGRQQPGYDRHV